MKLSTIELIAFIKQHVDWTEANVISDYFDVSTRTVRKKIKEINETHPGLIVSSYKGYKFNSSEYSEDVLENEDDLINRSDYIIRKLISANDPVSIYDLADEMHISDSSFERSLKVVKSTLKSFDLDITRKRYNICISGKERKKRKLINYLISKENQGSFFTDSSIPEEFLSHSISIEDTSKNLKRILNENQVFANDYGFNTILFHVLIMLDRILFRQAVQEEGAAPQYENTKVLADIKDYLEKAYSLTLPPTELYYLSMIISNNSSHFDSTSTPAKEIKMQIGQQYLEMSRKICEDLASNYCLDPFSDEFVLNLAVHIGNLSERVKSDTYTHNPLANNFKNQFPFIYDMAVFIAKELQEYFGERIVDDEIAFIAFHIGAFLENRKTAKDMINVCYIYSDYHAFFSDTLAKIKDEFGHDVYVSAAVSVNDSTQLKNDIDLIITTCHMETLLPTIEVGLFLSEKDIQNIRTSIDLIKLNRKRAELRKDLDHFIGKKLFKKEYYCRNNIEMIENLAKECVDLGLCDKNYVNEVIERESLASTSLRNGIAIPHSLKATSKNSFMSIVVNQKKMLWGTNYVSLIIMIGTSTNDRERFKNIYNQLVEVLFEPANVRILTKCDSYDEFLNTIIKLI